MKMVDPENQMKVIKRISCTGKKMKVIIRKRNYTFERRSTDKCSENISEIFKGKTLNEEQEHMNIIEDKIQQSVPGVTYNNESLKLKKSDAIRKIEPDMKDTELRIENETNKNEEKVIDNNADNDIVKNEQRHLLNKHETDTGCNDKIDNFKPVEDATISTEQIDIKMPYLPKSICAQSQNCDVVISRALDNQHIQHSFSELLETNNEMLVETHTDSLIDVQVMSSTDIQDETQTEKEVSIHTFSISEILECKKSQQFKLCLMKKETTKKKVSSSTYVIDNTRKDTVIELARLELNKLTMGNIQAVISKMKQLDIQTISESREIANCLLDKAISEHTFTKVYACLVRELRNVLKSKEELSMNIKQTAFFEILLKRAFDIVNEKVQWADTTKQINLGDFKNRILYEAEIEQLEEQRYKKKNRTIGAIKFVSYLYILNIISYNKVGERINQLMKDPHFESVEVLCAFISTIGEKMVSSHKEEIVNKIFNYLESIKSRYEFRILFLIETTLENRKKWRKPVKSNQTQNRFANMEIEKIEPVKKIIPIDNTSDILSFIGSIYSELVDSYDEDDKTIIADHFKRGVTNYGKQSFYSLYLSEAISDYKKSKVILPFFVDYFDRTGLTNKELVDILKKLLGNLKELKMDFPKAAVNYIEFICLLKVKGLLSLKLFESLKSPDFSIKSKEVISEWNESKELKDKITEIF